MKKINNKIKGVSIELDKNTQLKDLNETIQEFTKETDNKYEVKVSLTFETSHSTLHLKRIRKPYLTLATKNGKKVKKVKKKIVKIKK